MTAFDDALCLEPLSDNHWRVDVPEGWGQGRTVFGGLTAGYGVRVCEAASQRPIRVFDVSFRSPVEPGPAEVRLTDDRRGKYISQVDGGLFQRGRCCLQFRAVLGGRTQEAAARLPAGLAPIVELSQCRQMPYLQGIVPEFTQNLEMRLGEGEFPFTGTDLAVVGGYVRHRGAATGLAGLLAHLDAWPPAVLSTVTGPAPASTVRWSVHVHDDVHECDGTQWSWVRSRSDWYTGGLSTQTQTLLREGRPLLWAEQTVAVYR